MSKRSHRKKVKGTLVHHTRFFFGENLRPKGTLGTRHYINNNKKDVVSIIKVGD